MVCLFWMGQQQIDFNWIVSKNIESDWPSPRLKLPGFGPRVADRTIFWSVKSRRRSFTQFIIRRSCSFQHFLFRLWYWEQWNNFQIPRLVSVIFFAQNFPTGLRTELRIVTNNIDQFCLDDGYLATCSGRVQYRRFQRFKFLLRIFEYRWR